MTRLRASFTASAVLARSFPLRRGGSAGAVATARDQGPREAGLRPILLVEPDPARRARLREALTLAGFPVEAVRNDALARQALAPHRPVPALVIAATGTRDTDGHALCEALRCDLRTAEVPVLLTAEEPGEEEVRLSRVVGADDLLPSALPPEAWVALVQLETGERHADGRRVSRAGGIALPMLLRGLLAGHRAGRLSLLHPDGHLAFSGQRVIEARLGALTGADAARALLRADARVQTVHIGPEAASTGLALSDTALGLAAPAASRPRAHRVPRLASLPTASIIPFAPSTGLRP